MKVPIDLDRAEAQAAEWEGEIVWVTKRWLNQVFRELRQARAVAASMRDGRVLDLPPGPSK